MKTEFILEGKELVSYKSFINNTKILAIKKLLAHENNTSKENIKVNFVPSRRELHELINNLKKDNITPAILQKELKIFNFFLIKNDNYKYGAICTRLVDFSEKTGLVLLDYFIAIPVKKDGTINYDYRDYCSDTSFVNSEITKLVS